MSRRPPVLAAGGLTGSSTAKHCSKCQSPTAFHSRAPVCRDQHFKSECARHTVGCCNSPRASPAAGRPAVFFSLSELFLPTLPPSTPAPSFQLPFQPRSGIRLFLPLVGSPSLLLYKTIAALKELPSDIPSSWIPRTELGRNKWKGGKSSVLFRLQQREPSES